MPPRAFVTGGTGAVGSVLLRRLLEEGYGVRALTRSKPPADLPGVRWVRGDLASRAALAEGLEGASVVFHLAAFLHDSDPRGQEEARYTAVNVRGTEMLLEAAARAGAPRVVLASTINVYGAGSRDDEPFMEDSPLRPMTPYARSKCAAEALLKSYPDGTILRLAAVYGSTMKGNYLRLARWLASGARWMVGDGRNRRTLVHGEDAAEAAWLAATHPAARGRIFNVTDGNVHTLDRVACAIQMVQGIEPGLLYLPAGPVRAVLGVGSALLRGLRIPAPGTELVDKLLEDVAASGARIQKALGFVPRFDLLSGWREALAPATRDA